MKTYMFPGQGSQFVGMGEGLFDHYKELTNLADDILGYSIRKLCLEDPEGKLNNTEFTQPALFTVNALSYLEQQRNGGGKADFLAGHSLGEFNALLAAECFDFVTGLKLVKKRGELMGKVANGAMAAILNTTKEEVEEILSQNGLFQVYLANYNTPSQIVISGVSEEIAKAEAFFQQGKKRYYPLATSGAFHTIFMQEAMEAFGTYLQEFTFAAPKTPVIANITARPYQSPTITETLTSQISSMVRWADSIQYLLAQNSEMEFVELGPGDVLSRLVATIKAQTPETLLDQLRCEDSSPLNSMRKEAPQGEPEQLLLAEEKVKAWNKANPIGRKFESLLVAGVSLESRSEAVVLFGHRAAVYMQGYNGYFDLDELTSA